jgi:hypothetical protein
MTSLPAGHARTTHVEALHQDDLTRAVAGVVAVQVLVAVNVAVKGGTVEAMIGAAATGPVVMRTAVLAAAHSERAAIAAGRC